MTERQHAEISAVMTSDAFDASDKWVVKWQFKLLGDFQEALAACIARADDGNLDRLKLGFPVEVQGFLRWNRGDLAARLSAAGLDV